MENKNILDDEFGHDLESYQEASKWARLINYLMDTIGFYVLIVISIIIFNDILDIKPIDGSPLIMVYTLVLFVGYYTVFEYFLKRTPGKFLTSTIVIMEDNKEPKFKDIVVRSLCRMIPFDQISYLFSDSGWHDQISKTKVVYKKKIER